MNNIHFAIIYFTETVKAKVPMVGGAIDEANSLNTEIQGFLKNGAITLILIGFLITCWRKGWAAAALIGGIAIAGLGYFAVNGGMELIGNMFKQQLAG